VFSEEDKSHQQELSVTARRFLEYVESHPELLEHDSYAQLFRSVRAVVGTICGVDAPIETALQPWPVFLSPERHRELERVGLEVARLFCSVPERLFGSDARKIADFLGLESDLMASLLLAEPNLLRETLCRSDFLMTSEGLKLLEFNIGNLGGLQATALAPQILRQEPVQKFLEEQQAEVRSHDILESMFRHVLRHCLATPLAAEELNLLITIGNEGPWSFSTHPVPLYRKLFTQIMRELAPGKKGRVEVARMADVEFPGSEVHVRGRRFQAVIEQNDVRPSQEIFRSFKAGLVNCYTSPIGMILGDKRLLAALSTPPPGPDPFTPEERRLIEAHIPWTRRVVGKGDSFRGFQGDWGELLRRHREKLVLKTATGYGGAEVFVGPSLSDEAWNETVEQALAGDDWVVQEFLRALPVIAQKGARGAEPFNIVWGLFTFGEDYGGALLRMGAQSGSPVINITQGAQIGVGYEVLGTES